MARFKNKWHDLRINPKDLPKNNSIVYCKVKLTYTTVYSLCIYVEVEDSKNKNTESKLGKWFRQDSIDIQLDNIIAWQYLDTFEEL